MLELSEPDNFFEESVEEMSNIDSNNGPVYIRKHVLQPETEFSVYHSYWKYNKTADGLDP